MRAFKVAFLVCSALSFFTLAYADGRRATPPDLEGWTFAESDREVMEQGHWREASGVLGRLYISFQEGGYAAVRSAVPSVIKRLEEAQAKTITFEGEAEFKLSLLDFVANTADERAKTVLLRGMENGGVAKAMVRIGHSVVPAIIDSLKSTRFRMFDGAMNTLCRMAALDSTFFTGEERDTIRAQFESMTRDEPKIKRYVAIRGLRTFGNAGSIPVLERIVLEDDSNLRGKYHNRDAARDALQILRAR